MLQPKSPHEGFGIDNVIRFKRGAQIIESKLDQTDVLALGLHTPAASEKEARCEGTQTIHVHVKFQAWSWNGTYTTNDLPGCRNKGGLLLGTNKKDELAGREGADEIRGRGGRDVLLGGSGSDVLYGGRGSDWLYGGGGDDVLYGGDGSEGTDNPASPIVLQGGAGEDVIYGGDGIDFINAIDANRTYGLNRAEGQRDKLYCGKGKDYYAADKKDYVDSSCEKKRKPVFSVT